MENLKEDYKDDILDFTINQNRKYRMISNSDGTVSFEDVTQYEQFGDTFGASDVNAITRKVNKQSIQNNAGSHNAIYRGKYLGTEVTPEQYAAIAAGTFEDLYIGDYWTINGVNYRIAAFDYYLNCGEANAVTEDHHVVIVPDTNLYAHVMNEENVTTGAYVGSKMYTEGLEQAKTTIKAAFSGHVLSHKIYLNNATSSGKVSAGAWVDSEVDLMCEHMVYGNGMFTPVSDGSIIPANERIEKSQLPLFQHEPSRICNKNTWWLRDVISNTSFILVSNRGYARYATATNSVGVRPVFCIY